MAVPDVVADVEQNPKRDKRDKRGNQDAEQAMCAWSHNPTHRAMADTSQHHSYAQARDPMGRFAFVDPFDAKLAALAKMLAQQASAPPQQAQPMPMNALAPGMMGTQAGPGEGVGNFLARHGVDLSRAYGVKP